MCLGRHALTLISGPMASGLWWYYEPGIMGGPLGAHLPYAWKQPNFCHLYLSKLCRAKCSHAFQVCDGNLGGLALRASPAVLSMWPWKKLILHIQVLQLLILKPTIKLKLGLQIPLWVFTILAQTWVFSLSVPPFPFAGCFGLIKPARIWSIANRSETTNNNSPGPIKLSSQSKTEVQSLSIFWVLSFN